MFQMADSVVIKGARGSCTRALRAMVVRQERYALAARTSQAVPVSEHHVRGVPGRRS